MRQLVAILFADMTGYTALMQENELLARQKRKRFKEVLDSSIKDLNGKTLQYYGDGSLSIFSSAIEAVNCAIKMQQLLQQHPVVDVRIGIHTGDVIIEEETIYGDGVNLASRIESIAAPGSVLISEKVYDEIRNQEGVNAIDLGYFEFKNVRQPIRVHAISNNGINIPSRESLRGKTTTPSNRLAVLPFVNMSPDPENEYFSDGITEELLNALTKVDGLQVTSRTSSFAFKGKNNDIRDIAISLNVDKVLEGSVRKAGNRVRITAQLINAADGYHIWSENYDRDLTDIFVVQDEISGIIANKLKENLTPSLNALPLVKPSTKNINAYTSYLKGLHYRNKITPADARTAIRYFEEAIAIEPSYALPCAMIAEAYSYLGASGQMSPHKAFAIVQEYADRALQLDESVAEGYIARASRFLYYEWNWNEAFEALQKAIQLNPGAIAAYRLLAFYYLAVGKKNEAVNVLEEAMRIDPLSPVINHALGNMYIYAARYDDAIRQAEKLLEMEPNMRIAIELKAWANGMKGKWEEALELFHEVHRLTNHPLKGLMGVGYALGKLGRRDEAMDCVRKIEERQRLEPEAVVDADLVGVWFALGNLDKVFYHINKCIENRTAPINFFLEYPVFDLLRNDPRYYELKKKAEAETQPSK
jgi:TolB-like protein/Flp pilus assembly protein TadD